MSDDRDFVNGMIIKKPNDNAPDWVKANPDDEWINIDIKESQKGTWYAERDTWKPEKKDSAPAAKETDDIPW